MCTRARLRKQLSWRALEENGQFRFTAPTHALLAFEQALRQHEAEGGHAGRLRRYEANCCVLMDGMRALGKVAELRMRLQGGRGQREAPPTAVHGKAGDGCQSCRLMTACARTRLRRSTCKTVAAVVQVS